jgi:hypothetical protein
MMNGFEQARSRPAAGAARPSRAEAQHLASEGLAI